MTNVQICSPSILPTYNDLYDLFDDLYAIPGITLPTQLTVPSPVWPSINIPQTEIEITITEMIQSQMSGVLLGLFQPIIDFLGIDLEDILPDIPGFPDFNLINILDGELQDLIDLASLPNFDFSAISLLPSPIYPNYSFPNRQALVAVQTAINQYYQMLTNVITDLINQVTDILQLPTLSIPTYPTLSEIMDLLPPIPTLQDLFTIEIPGFDFELAMPVPLIPNINIPSPDFLQGLRNLYAGLSTEVESIIIDFVEDILPFSFNFPTFCLVVVVPD